MTPYNTIEVGPITVKIYPDDSGDMECPLDCIENYKESGIIFAAWERRCDWKEWNPFETPEEAREFARENDWSIFALRKYDHSSVGYSVANKSYPFNCPWDSWQVGYILVDPKHFKETPHLEVAESWCKAVTTWCNGDYYGYVIEDADGEHLDSCWGFDDADYCESQALELAKHHAEKANTETAHELESERPDMYESPIGPR